MFGNDLILQYKEIQTVNLNILIPGVKRRAGKAFLAGAMVVIALLACGFKPVSVTVEDNLALKGYDTVAYFTVGKGVVGSPIYSVEWGGAVWRFSSKTNMRLFRENPEKYAPQFGGYCAIYIADNQVVSCDPEAFLIVDNKLYILLNQRLQKIWERNLRENIGAAEKNWSHLMSAWRATERK